MSSRHLLCPNFSLLSLNLSGFVNKKSFAPLRGEQILWDRTGFSFNVNLASPFSVFTKQQVKELWSFPSMTLLQLCQNYMSLCVRIGKMKVAQVLIAVA